MNVGEVPEQKVSDVPEEAVGIETDPWLSAEESQEIAYAYESGLVVLLGQC